MRHVIISVKTALFLGLGGSLPQAFGGTVITTNLPANTAIVNISGTEDGAAVYSGVNAALWYQPFFTGGAAQLLEYTVQPGTYGFRVINPADAARLFPALIASQASQIFTGWTYNSPWATDYLVFDSAAATNGTLPQLFDGAFSNTNGTWYTYGSAAAAYQAAISGGFYNLIRTGSDGRNGLNGQNGTLFRTSYTFASATTLIFAVPDYYLPDNNGGVSVLISPATSLPVLSIFSGTGTVTLRWPTNASGFSLSQTPDLQPTSWGAVTNVPAVINTNFSVTLPVASASKLFRLHNP
jgi:hypothetical protein